MHEQVSGRQTSHFTGESGDAHAQGFPGRSTNIGPEIGHRPSSSLDSGQGVPEHVRPHLRSAASLIIRGHDHP